MKIGDEPTKCLSVEYIKLKTFSADRVVLGICETYPPREQKWAMIESGNAGMRLCQIGFEKCLTYDPKGVSAAAISLKKRDEEDKTQLFKMNIETSQLEIAESRSCLMGVFRSYPYVSGVEVRSCDEKIFYDKTYKIWSVVPLNNCL